MHHNKLYSGLPRFCRGWRNMQSLFLYPKGNPHPKETYTTSVCYRDWNHPTILDYLAWKDLYLPQSQNRYHFMKREPCGEKVKLFEAISFTSISKMKSLTVYEEHLRIISKCWSLQISSFLLTSQLIETSPFQSFLRMHLTISCSVHIMNEMESKLFQIQYGQLLFSMTFSSVDNQRAVLYVWAVIPWICGIKKGLSIGCMDTRKQSSVWIRH